MDKNTFLFPPIFRREVFRLSPAVKDFILVYLTSGYEEIIPVLKEINKKFVIYGLNRQGRENNIFFKKPSQKEFLEDLANCEGVIANSGFTLISEALYLGKPYLAMPIKGQFEQVLNAYYLEKLGYGKYWEEINKERIESFLYNLGLYQERLKEYEKADNSEIFQKIDSLIEEYSLDK